MNTFFKSKILVLSFILVAPFSLLKYSEHHAETPTLISSEINPVNNIRDCVLPDNPLKIIIGEDLSMSFSKFSPIRPEDIEAICRTVAKSGRGGEVIVGAVGNQDAKGYITCELKPLPQAPKGGTISTVAYCRNLAKKIDEENEQAIQTFTAQCKELLKNKTHKITDISGFLNKAKVLSEQPGAGKYETWLYINSDGEQDIDPRKKEVVDCSKKPDAKKVKFYVSSWPDSISKCDAHGSFLDPQQFVKFFQSQIK
ncbi:MAG: hypothetical protein KF852_10945 [Saprospiraceae bacterium]|nr:hypothetical protein [Saprospiraceae bacterium]